MKLLNKFTFVVSFLSRLFSPMISAAAVISSAFVNSISVVIHSGTYGEMIWINTTRVIATMHDYLVGLYNAAMNFIRDSMGPEMPKLTLVSLRDFTVPVFILAGSPVPAGVGFINFLPERFHKLCKIIQHGNYYTQCSVGVK